MKNPDWTRDELILALNLYVELGGTAPLGSDRRIVALSDLLNRLTIHSMSVRTKDFRNENGVVMKLMNFRRFDRASKGGLPHGAELEEVVWNSFVNDRERLFKIADGIRAANLPPRDELDERYFPEGQLLYRLHRVRETESDAARAKTREVDDGVTCTVCSFNVIATFGSVGRGLIEIHDTTDVAELVEKSRPAKNSLSLVFVCSNCHRALHRHRPWLAKSTLWRLRPSAALPPQASLTQIARDSGIAAKTTVHDLGPIVVEWLRARSSDPSCEWPYHPRSNELSDRVRRQVLQDLLRSSSRLASDARAGRIACDINARLVSPSGRAKKIDLVLGTPVPSSLRGVDEAGGIQKARLSKIAVSLEIKTCMTEHGKATPRLIDELLSSLDVVKGANPNGIAFAVLVVNAAKKFTSPLNPPGPNIHAQPAAADSVIRGIRDRIPLGPSGYDAFAISLLETDNETKFVAVDSAEWVPTSHQYNTAITTVARYYEAMSQG